MNDDETPPPSPWGQRPDDPHNRGNGRRQQEPGPSNGLRRTSNVKTFLIGVIIFLVVLVIASWLIPDAGPEGRGNMSGLIYDGLWLTLIGAALWAHVRSSPGRALRHMATWVIIFGVLALGYSIWTGSGRLGGELDSAKGISNGDSISFRADMSGHYFVRAEVNGEEILFMVDTGATDVALTRSDAQRIGLPVDQLRYNMRYSTANGEAYGARVKLDKIVLGPITEYNIVGSVLPKGLQHSLLGMSFLNTLSGYKVIDGVLTLYP